MQVHIYSRINFINFKKSSWFN